MRRCRSDLGIAGWVILATVAFFGGGLAVLVDIAQGSVAREERPPPPVVVQLAPITVHAPPDDDRQRACVMQVASSFGLTWSATDGWTSADYPRPRLSGGTSAAQNKADQALKTEWENDTRSRVNLAATDWASCLKLVDPPEREDPPTENRVLDWGGTWTLTSNRPEAERDTCPVPRFLVITLEENGNHAMFHLDGKQPVRAVAEGLYRFVADDPAQNGLHIGVDLVAESGRNILVGNYSDGGVEFPCDSGFKGVKGSSDRP